MKKYIGKALSLLTAVMIFALCIPVNARAANTDDLSDIGGRIEAFVAENKDTMAGLMVSVADRGGNIYTSYFGYADMENKIPVDDETVMEWGSISKLQVWVSVMQLKEKGLISLDEDIRAYLPDGFLTRLKYDTPITMTDLMNHQAGFDEVPFIWAGSEEQLMPIEEWLKRTEPAQVYEPGTISSYSNWGAALAAYIVECVSGQPYEKYVREHIFEPLGMEHTSIMPDASDNEWVRNKRRTLKTYPADLSGEPLSFGDYYCYPYPAGACMSTMADMQRFAGALLDENSPLFKRTETHRELLSPSDHYNDTDIGSNYHGFCYNIFYSGTVIGHLGATVGCSSALWIDIEKGVYIAVMTNQHEESTFTDGLPELIFERYEGELPEFKGLVQSSQVVRSGPFKLQRLFGIQYLTLDSTKKTHTRISRTHENGIDRFKAGSSDLIVKEKGDVLPDIVSIAVYAISVLIAVIMLIVGIIRAVRHGKSGNTAWCILSAGIQLIPVFVLYNVVRQLVLEQPPFLSIGTVRLMLVPIFAVLIANIALIVHGVKSLTKSDTSRAIGFVTLVMLVLGTYGIAYWELFEFWKI